MFNLDLFDFLYRRFWQEEDEKRPEIPPHMKPENDKSGMKIPDLSGGTYKRN